MSDATESAAQGELELMQQADGWARSDDPAQPRGETRSVPPGSYPVVSQLAEGDEHFYCLDLGEDVFVAAQDGTYHPRASGG